MKNINSYQNRSESYHFEDDSTFSWYGYGGVGKGRVRIINDSIRLTFLEVKRTFEVQINDKNPNSSKDSHIEVRAIHSNGKPFRGLLIGLRSSDINTETDGNGIAIIDVKDAIQKDIMNVHIEDTYAVWDIDLRGHDHLIAIVVNDKGSYKNNQTITYHFRKRGKSIYLNGIRYRKYLPLM